MLKLSPLESYSAYLDGHCLSDAEVEALRSWIAADPCNAAEFVQFASVHAAITDRLMLGRLLEDLAANRGLAGITPAMLAEAIREIEVNSPRVVLPMPPAPPAPERTPLSHILAPVAAVLAILCLGAWAVWNGGGAAPPMAQAPHRGAAEAKIEAPEPPKVAARMSTSFDAKWSDPSDQKAIGPGDNLLEGARLNLLAGVVQLDMVGGATVVVEGPSDVQLTSADSLRLAQGKTAVRIGGASESFIVDTPSMQVIDLGTEFGVETAASGEGQVMVFDGSVALAEAPGEKSDKAPEDVKASIDRASRVEAGFQVSVSSVGGEKAAPAEPERLINERHFLRPDEVEVRLRALAGSTADRKLAAHYERQRIKGLLAYQGFDAASSGADYVLGTDPQGLIAQATMEFVEQRGGAEGHRESAAEGSGITIQDGPVFLSLDTSAEGPFAQAGLLNDSGRIGRSGEEIWLSWRSQRLSANSDQFGSAGLSLMFGERSDLDEPMFFGRGFGESETIIVQSAWGGSPPPEGERVTVNVDFDIQSPGVQDRPVDDAAHTWVARVEFREGADRVSLWVDPDLGRLKSADPQAILDTAEVEFDRVRLAVNRADEVWQFGEFAAASGPRALEQLTQVAEFREDK